MGAWLSRNALVLASEVHVPESITVTMCVHIIHKQHQIEMSKAIVYICENKTDGLDCEVVTSSNKRKRSDCDNKCRKVVSVKTQRQFENEKEMDGSIQVANKCISAISDGPHLCELEPCDGA